MIGGSFGRVQFTPNLVPADLLGTRIYNGKTGELVTELGPVFANLLLANEINRAPRQSAWLISRQRYWGPPIPIIVVPGRVVNIVP